MVEDKEMDPDKSAVPPDTEVSTEIVYITKDEVQGILIEYTAEIDGKIEQLRKDTAEDLQGVKDTTLNTNQAVQQLKLSIASIRTSQNLATLFTGVFVTILMKIINHFFK